MRAVLGCPSSVSRVHFPHIIGRLCLEAQKDGGAVYGNVREGFGRRSASAGVHRHLDSIVGVPSVCGIQMHTPARCPLRLLCSLRTRTLEHTHACTRARTHAHAHAHAHATLPLYSLVRPPWSLAALLGWLLAYTVCRPTGYDDRSGTSRLFLLRDEILATGDGTWPAVPESDGGCRTRGRSSRRWSSRSCGNTSRRTSTRTRARTRARIRTTARASGGPRCAMNPCCSRLSSLTPGG